LNNGKGPNGNFCCDHVECKEDGFDLCSFCVENEVMLRVFADGVVGHYDDIKVKLGSDHGILLGALCEKQLGQQIVQDVGTHSAFYAVTCNGICTTPFCAPDANLWRGNPEHMSQIYEKMKKYHYVVLKPIQPIANETGIVATTSADTLPSGADDHLRLLRKRVKTGATSSSTSNDTTGPSDDDDWFSKHVQCPICLDTQTDLRKTCAMHFVCYKCEPSLRDGYSSCPSCKGALIGEGTRHTIAGDFVTLLEESMRRSGAVFTCPHDGCGFSGTYTALRQHDVTCLAKLIKCDHCPSWYQRGQEREHLMHSFNHTTECG
jgi:hypothetical protein